MAMIQYQIFFHFDNGYAQQLVNIKLLICVYMIRQIAKKPAVRRMFYRKSIYLRNMYISSGFARFRNVQTNHEADRCFMKAGKSGGSQHLIDRCPVRIQTSSPTEPHSITQLYWFFIMTQYMHVKSIIQVRCLTEPHTKYIYFILTLNIHRKKH